MSSNWSAPKWIHSLYSSFPLVTLVQDDKLPEVAAERVLWIVPPQSQRSSWASADPTCLRAQLLLRLRGVNVAFRSWDNPSTAPGGSLPALHLPKESRLIPADDLREWLDEQWPLDSLQGFPDEDSHDKALALAQLILGRVHLATSPGPLTCSTPPPLAAGLITPLPASLTGDDRILDPTEASKRLEEAWNAVENLVTSRWALGAERPTPLDALIAAHGFTQGIDQKRPQLGEYITRVMEDAER